MDPIGVATFRPHWGQAKGPDVIVRHIPDLDWHNQRKCSSKSAEQNQDQHDDEDETETASAIIARSIKGASADAAKSTQQCDNQNNEYDCAY